MKTLWIAIAAVTLAVGGFYAWRTPRFNGHDDIKARARQSTVTAAAATPVAPPQPSTPQDAGNATRTDESLKILGPFSIGGRDYSVRLHRNLGNRTSNGIVSMEIRDAAGGLQYQRTFPVFEATGEEVEGWSVTALVLTGAYGKGLLVSYDFYEEPSAPEEEPTGWYQVFGAVNGKLVPFGAPLEIEGGLLDENVSGNAYKTSQPSGTATDVVEFRMWTGHCRVVYPVRVDWVEGKLAPALECARAEESGRGCQFQVLPEEKLYKDDITFVRLWPNPDESQGKPERTVVKKDSKVELLTASFAPQWADGPPARSLSNSKAATGNVGDGAPDAGTRILIRRDEMKDAGEIGVASRSDLWLKVRIDGKEGWMHTEEDFRALGLPEDQ